MNYNELQGYFTTLNLVIEVFEKIGLSEQQITKIYDLGDLIDSAYYGNVPKKFERDDDQVMSEEEFYKGMLLDDSGKLILDKSGCGLPDPNFSVLKKRSFLKLVNQSFSIKPPTSNTGALNT